MHADHAGGQGVASGEAAAAHEADGYRGVQLFGKRLEFLVRPAQHHAAAADDEGPLGLLNHL